MSRTLVEANVDLTLMVMDPNGDYRPSSVMTFQYFIAAHAAFAADLSKNCVDLLVKIYNEHNRIFRDREPNDLNYIAVVGVAPRVIEPADWPSQPWLHGKCPGWEESNLVGLHNDGYNKISPGLFEGLLKSSL